MTKDFERLFITTSYRIPIKPNCKSFHKKVWLKLELRIPSWKFIQLWLILLILWFNLMYCFVLWFLFYKTVILLNTKVEQSRIMSRIMSRTVSKYELNRVDRLEQGRIMSRTGSNHESNRVESWVEQGRIMSRTGSNH